MKVWIYKGEVAGTRAERQAQAAARAGVPGRGGRPQRAGGEVPSARAVAPAPTARLVRTVRLPPPRHRPLRQEPAAAAPAETPQEG